jgi:hypothetical protein
MTLHYRLENWSYFLEEENDLQASENKVVKNTFSRESRFREFNGEGTFFLWQIRPPLEAEPEDWRRQ